MPPRIDDDKRAAILADIKAGELSARRIAAKHGVAQSTVSKLAKDTGEATAFDRSKTVRATRARTLDAAAVRAELTERRLAMAVTLHDVAAREVRKMAEPTTYWDWGGKDHDYDETTRPEPHAQDRRAMMATVAQALDKSLKLVPQTEQAGEQSRSLVGDLMAGLARDYAERHGGPPPEVTDDGE
ncbi:helix-turn-helix domain-containing protein [Yinghuangia soli]|uniref:Helix-turn-helix domain-containing protein n=1 Tax=Yinghuangia soli TaxID=2908204 RepID=A0AA41Q689_9ACTN|nr:helix-turn-helix domain-containing protein [Yinghuangia soli]MCF2531740.1 helix-turn-helix domain-containing protein [Yinghuangia soli]